MGKYEAVIPNKKLDNFNLKNWNGPVRGHKDVLLLGVNQMLF